MLLFLIKVFSEERAEAIMNLNLVGFLWKLGNQYTLSKHLLASSSERLKFFFIYCKCLFIIS